MVSVKHSAYKQRIDKEVNMEDIIDILKEDFSDKTSDLTEALLLLKEIINSTMEEISKEVAESFKHGQFHLVDRYKLLGEKGLEYGKIIDHIIALLEEEYGERVEEKNQNNYKIKQELIPDHEAYRINNREAYSLSDDFTHKRPYGFKFLRNDIYRVKTWSDMLVKTCEILYDINPKRFNNLENVPEMNGKRKKHFSKNRGDLRKPSRIRDGIYVETNHSANTITGKITQLLEKYEFEVSEFKIYLRADYADLHK